MVSTNTLYANDFPQDGQNRSVTITGLPHLGQKPADLAGATLAARRDH